MEDLKLFAYKSLGINNIHITFIKDRDLTVLETNSNHKFIKALKTKEFLYYISYLFLILFLLVYLLSDEKKSYKKDEIEAVNKKIKTIKKQKEFYFLSSLVLQLYEQSKNKKIYINSIKVKNSILQIELESKNKEQMYSLINEYTNSKISNMTYNENKERFILDASFKILRK